MKILDADTYLKAAAIHCRKYIGEVPNFLMSPYWLRACGYLVSRNCNPCFRESLEVRDPEDGQLVLPGIYLDDYSLADEKFEAGFATESGVPSLWDKQYVYRPSRILDGWQGGQFRGRRKALLLALRNLNARLENCQLVPWEKSRDEKPTQDFLADWAGKKGDGVFDPDRMVEAVLGTIPAGLAQRLTLIVKDKPMGVSVIDPGLDCWVNYRYCLVAPGIPGLSELCRMFTWDYLARHTTFKLINDGGCLDCPGLEQFKDKLCPAYKLNVPTTKE